MASTNLIYRVTGDFNRLVYSRHASAAAAVRAAKKLARRWGWSHSGSEPIAEYWDSSEWRPFFFSGPN